MSEFIKSCFTVGCVKPAAARGLCCSCHDQAVDLIVREKETWESLADIGLVDVSEILFYRAYRNAKPNGQAILDLNLSARATNALQREGILTVDALVSRTASQLSELRNVAKITIDEIRTVLAKRGLSLRGEFPQL